MKIKTILNRFFISIDSILTSSFSKKRVVKNHNNALIVFQQIFGDSILFSAYVNDYCRTISSKYDVDVTIAFRENVLSFFDLITDRIDGVEYKTIDFEKLSSNFLYYKKIKKSYRNSFDYIIVPGTSFSAELLSSICNCYEKIACVASEKRKTNFVMRIIDKNAYTTRIIPPPNTMVLERHSYFLNELYGEKVFMPRLPSIKKIERVLDFEYCVVSFSSSMNFKKWPIERFATISDYIINKYGINVVVCGGKEDKIYEEEFFGLINSNKNKVISKIGKTDFKEWISIIQNSKFVVGNDSASIHIAAASGVKSICIAGLYDKYQFFPYPKNVSSNKDLLPMTLMVEKECENCRTMHYFAGAGNKECKKRIDNGMCSLCIDEVKVETVIECIDELVNSR